MTDQQWTSDRRTSRRTSDGPVTGKQRTSRQTRSKQHLMQLHSRSLFFTRHRQQQSVRNRHAVISISHSCNEHTTPPHATSFLKPPLHASPTSRNHHTVIATSHSYNEHIITLHTISFLNNHLHSSSTAAICTQSACSHLDLPLTQ